MHEGMICMRAEWKLRGVLISPDILSFCIGNDKRPEIKEEKFQKKNI